MRTRILLMRAAPLALLALVLALLGSMSSLLRFLPPGPWALWLLPLFALALLPALLARETPLPAAALVVVPVLAASAYGASRLDWLRVLKDFGVAEADAASLPRLGLGALSLALLWALHAVDLATRLRVRAVERGIEPDQAKQAARRSLRESARALGLALAGAAGLLLLGIVGLRVAELLPTARAALAAPLLAAALLVAAALYLARGQAAR